MPSCLQELKKLGGDRGTFVRNAVPAETGAVLDIGCAFGWNLDAISESADRLVGVDVNEEALVLARESYPHLTFRQCSGTDLPFEDGGFDVVILSEVIEHVGEENKQAVVDEAHRDLTS